MKEILDLRAMTISDLEAHLLNLRKNQFTLRMKKANGSLDKSHHVTSLRKSIARVKTLMTEKAGTRDV
jgi:large subunit ribosomal protein L29